MDLKYYRERERVERRHAEEAKSEAVRSVHLKLADSYRNAIESHERPDTPEAVAG
ncbi:MAG: hypothetical protein ACXWUN_07420 [Allosphingosinicella sp.]